MPPSTAGSLQEYEIYLDEDHDTLDKCPTKLQDLFKLIISVQDLKYNRFGGHNATDSNDVLPELELSCAKETYEKELKNEADLLRWDCKHTHRKDDIEDKWVKILEPVVFYRFDGEQEEKYSRDRHQHW